MDFGVVGRGIILGALSARRHEESHPTTCTGFFDTVPRQGHSPFPDTKSV